MEDQQNSPQLSVNNISMTEITPILETYGQQLETFQTSQTSFGTLTTDSRSINFPDTNQPLAQTVSYHNEFQPMSTQQRAAMAQAALINFFGDSGTISSIMHMVQPSQSQTLTEQSNQPTIDSEVMVSNNQQGMSLPISTHQTSYNNLPYTIPHIAHSRRTSTNTNTTTQQDYNRQSYRVPQYYSNPHSYSDRRRVRRQNTHNHHKERKHPRKDDRQ